MPAQAVHYDGFTGPSYATLSPAESCDRSVNYYFESVEVPHQAKTDAALYPRPGCFPYGNQADYVMNNPQLAQPVRAELAYDGNNVPNGCIFGISGNVAWQMNKGGLTIIWGTVVNDGKPAYIVANSATVGQVAFISGGNLYVLANGVFSVVANDGVNFFGARAGAFIDGYLIVLSVVPNGQQFQFSDINDMTSWNAANVALLEGQADPIQTVIVNQEYIYFLGYRRGEIWYNSGAAPPAIPFTIQTGAFLEAGTNSPASVCQLKNQIYYMVQDARGENWACKVAGLQAVRISNHAVEAAWSGYSTTDDVICYPWTWNGHQLIRYIFPTADKGWEYDDTESAKLGYPVWNEVSFTDQNGVQHAPLERAHAYGLFNAHLIGSGGADGAPGLIYQFDQNTYTDAVGNFQVAFAQSGQSGTALMLTGMNATDTSLNVFSSTLGGFAVPFYFIIAGGLPAGEICQCTVYTPGSPGAAALTIVRGIGGSTAQIWPANTVISEAIFPGFPITRQRVVRLPYNNGLRTILDRLEILFRSGVGNLTDPNPNMVMNIAGAFGPTGPIFGPDIQIPMGMQGQYQLRAIANRLGKYRDGALSITITDPVLAVLVGAVWYGRKLAA